VRGERLGTGSEKEREGGYKVGVRGGCFCYFGLFHFLALLHGA
jgi:hypothetical protein